MVCTYNLLLFLDFNNLLLIIFLVSYNYELYYYYYYRCLTCSLNKVPEHSECILKKFVRTNRQMSLASYFSYSASGPSYCLCDGYTQFQVKPQFSVVNYCYSLKTLLQLRKLFAVIVLRNNVISRVILRWKQNKSGIS